jgi:hypothetical protein
MLRNEGLRNPVKGEPVIRKFILQHVHLALQYGLQIRLVVGWSNNGLEQ